MDPAMAQGQLALSMMTPEQRKAAVEQALAQASPEERKQMELQKKEIQKKFEQAGPEEKRAMAQQAELMKDMGTFCRELRPEGGDPNRVLSTVDVLSAMAECGSFASLTQAIKSAPADKQKAIIRAFLSMEKALLDGANEADAAALRASKAKPEQRRPLLLLLWILYKHKADVGGSFELDETVEHYYIATKRLATQLLMQAQMMLPQQRWVQQTLAVSRVSALLVNELWDTSDECKERMRKILAPEDTPEEAMPYPQLSLKARTALFDELQNGVAPPLGDSHPPVECLPSQLVAVEIELTRGHANQGAIPADIADQAANPKGIVEAYWLYLQGHTRNGQAHTLLAAHPLTVTDLKTEKLPHVCKFEAPKEMGTYDLTVHITSTSVVGCDLAMPLQFIVKEDDVPALE